jgi:hypothetical protein
LIYNILNDSIPGAQMVAGKVLLDMLKFVQSNLKEVKEESDRKIISEITQSSIFKSELKPKELATLLRVYRDLKSSLKP